MFYNYIENKIKKYSGFIAFKQHYLIMFLNYIFYDVNTLDIELKKIANNIKASKGPSDDERCNCQNIENSIIIYDGY